MSHLNDTTKNWLNVNKVDSKKRKNHTDILKCIATPRLFLSGHIISYLVNLIKQNDEIGEKITQFCI